MVSQPLRERIILCFQWHLPKCLTSCQWRLIPRRQNASWQHWFCCTGQRMWSTTSFIGGLIVRLAQNAFTQRQTELVFLIITNGLDMPNVVGLIKARFRFYYTTASVTLCKFVDKVTNSEYREEDQAEWLRLVDIKAMELGKEDIDLQMYTRPEWTWHVKCRKYMILSLNFSKRCVKSKEQDIL